MPTSWDTVMRVRTVLVHIRSPWLALVLIPPVLLSGCVGPEMDEAMVAVDLEIRVSNSLMQDAVFRITLNHGESIEVDAPFGGTINVRTAFQGEVPAGRLHILVEETKTNTTATETFDLEDENWVVASVWSDGEEEHITITWHPQEPVHG